MLLNYKSFDYDAIRRTKIQKRKRGNPRTKVRRDYKNIICAFDIETTRVTDTESIMFIWQAQIGEQTVIGRSWKECMRFFRRLADCCGPDQWIVLWVHNLSFEFSYLAGQYHFDASEVFATGPRRVLRCDMMQHLEFRCSYLHSNMSLREYLDKMGVANKKTTFDYNLKRYPWTPLSDKELEYCVNDVKGLVQAIQIEMDHDGDNLYSICATSTGYVRRDVKRAMRRCRQGYVKSMLPTWPIYELLREAFRGGNVHANRFYAGVILEGVGSVDLCSAYPTAQCNRQFPVTAFQLVKDPTPEKLIDLVKRKHRAVLARIQLHGVRLREWSWGCPYIPADKCRDLRGDSRDNGRILSADYLEITVTDIDLNIILKEYTFDSIGVRTLAWARYGWLPDPLLDVIEDYFRRKTVETGIARVKAKNKLNSVYGMSATNPVRVSVKYDSTHPDSFREELDATPQQLLEESNRKAFFPYQWGVWTTCWCRDSLEFGIEQAHKQGAFVYCDTDSVKYLGDLDLSEWNHERILDSEASRAYADDKHGKRKYMGVFEYEGRYRHFATRGAKKYAYTNLVQGPEGDDVVEELHITIAGVNKRAGAKELEAAGGLPAFLRETFTFKEDENEAVYVDHVRRFDWIDGHRIRIAPCVTIRPSYKTLSDTEDYSLLILTSKNLREFTLDKFDKIL